MTHWKIQKSQLNGKIDLPSSKSQTLRAILFASLAEGKSLIRGALRSPDTAAMLAACRSLGADIREGDDVLEIIGLNGKVSFAENVIDAGNSGIVLRFLTAVAALSSHLFVITGDHSIRHLRPMQPLIEALNLWQVDAISTKQDGYAPLIIQGPIHGEETTVDGRDSQFVSALLIAAAFSGSEKKIFVKDPGETPWVDLTLDWFDRLGISYHHLSHRRYSLPGTSVIKGFEYHVPGDLSSMAFPLVAALITGSELQIGNVDLSDSQGDKKIIDVLTEMGARFEYDAEKRSLRVMKTQSLKGTVVNVNDCIDAVPILSVVGCFAEGTTYLENARVARDKECDRLAVMTQELRKMGALIEEQDAGLVIQQSSLKSANVIAHEDHRVAMSLAVAGFCAEGATVVNNTSCAAKTYSAFVEDFFTAGALIEELS